MDTPHLFSPLSIREIAFRNRIAVSPMCQYSSIDGFASDWHLVHLGSRAVGGAGLVMMEATAVEPRGRITPGDHGIWKDDHIAMLTRIASFLKERGAVPGIQLAHAGRKASCHVPWDNNGAPIPVEAGGWETVAPSAIPFRTGDPVPRALDHNGIREIVDAFAQAAERALTAGFEVLELHCAHGYLAHEFLSPLANQRTDEYGGCYKNRIRFALEVTDAVRTVWPERFPLFVRISCTDWKEGGWTLDDSVALASELRGRKVDLIDCSSGAMVPDAKIPAAPGFQVPFAERIKKEANIRTGAVGMITDPHQADEIVRSGKADIVLLAREFLRDPYWPLHAAQALGQTSEPPVQYLRAFPKA
ncbi:MAG TPA: NADH:flavin oxidoreductase/NADH oxidase [Bryobacteraceae bacterium]|nr:NADH:flavin oxidoreductase/NADH oxidase [Bryobacteraceae bacterium]